MAEFGAVLDKHCAAIGRDSASIRRSRFAFQGVLGLGPFADIDTWRKVVQEYIASGASEIYFKFPGGRERQDPAAGGSDLTGT